MPKPRIKLKSVAAPQQGAISSTPYTSGDVLMSDVLANYHPSIGSPDGDHLRTRDLMVARARDLTRNNGWAAGAVTKETEAVVGAEFRPVSKPDWKALALDADWALEFKAAVDARWRSYAEDPRFLADATRSQPLSLCFALAYRHYCLDGEAIGALRWMTNRPTHTVLRVIDPDLLSNPDGRADDVNLRGGIEIDADGAAMAYHIRNAHPRDPWGGVNAMTWARWPREKAWGRPMVLHFFDKHRDGQHRGVSRLSPIVEKLRAEQRYSDIEIQAAVINAVLGAFIESPFDNEAIVDLLSDSREQFEGYTAMRNDFHAERNITLAGATIQKLFPGEKVGTISAARPAAQFADFESAVLRQIAAGIGISYEQLSSDWSKTNYSSARAAMIEVWRGWIGRRQAFAHGFCQPFRMAWLEEEIDRGFIKLPASAPDFRQNWAAYSRAKWIGPGKGFVDPVKEAQAAAMRVALGMSTLEQEAAELTGADYRENLDQIGQEIAQMPEGMLHPAQESFAKLLGNPSGEEVRDDRAAANI